MRRDYPDKLTSLQPRRRPSLRKSFIASLLVLLTICTTAGCTNTTLQAPISPTFGAGCILGATPPPYCLPSTPRVLLFGDSYTTGLGAVPPSNGYAYVIRQLSGWNVTIDGSSGTGYVNAGPKNVGSYFDRIAAMPATNTFDLVVIQGSSNDQKDLKSLSAAVLGTITVVRLKFPGAAIAMVGPVSVQIPNKEMRVQMDDMLASAASAAKVVYISPIRESWITDAQTDSLVNPANHHPNNAGYAIIAKRLLADLQSNIKYSG